MGPFSPARPPVRFRGAAPEGCLKKIVFYGDGVLCPPDGYSEPLVDLCVLRHPEAPVESIHLGEPLLTLETAARGAAALIGKAPDLVYLGLGHPDLLRQGDSAANRASLQSLLQLLLRKTQTRIVLASVCEAFLPEERREAAQAHNAALQSLEDGRVRFLDLNAPVNAFLARHRLGTGEKRALHGGTLRLTSMGKVFLSNAAFEGMDWTEFFVGTDASPR